MTITQRKALASMFVCNMQLQKGIQRDLVACRNPLEDEMIEAAYWQNVTLLVEWTWWTRK